MSWLLWVNDKHWVKAFCQELIYSNKEFLFLSISFDNYIWSVIGQDLFENISWLCIKYDHLYILIYYKLQVFFPELVLYFYIANEDILSNVCSTAIRNGVRSNIKVKHVHKCMSTVNIFLYAKHHKSYFLRKNRGTSFHAVCWHTLVTYCKDWSRISNKCFIV